jgi:hypothetical protein
LKCGVAKRWGVGIAKCKDLAYGLWPQAYTVQEDRNQFMAFIKFGLSIAKTTPHSWL